MCGSGNYKTTNILCANLLSISRWSRDVLGLTTHVLLTGMKLKNVSRYSAYWEQTRNLYAPFETTTTMRSGNADVYVNEIPGEQ